MPEEFILYVGRIEKRKNIEGIFKIAALLPEKKFILVGEGGYSGSKELLKKIKEQKNINHLKFVDDEDLPHIYNLAKIFLFPSFYEGFGLPVLEAMKSGLPVLTSNTSSLPEVVGEGGIMHDPNDYQEFVKDIRKLFEDEKFYQEMKKRAISVAGKFNCKKSTEELVEVFRSHLARRRFYVKIFSKIKNMQINTDSQKINELLTRGVEQIIEKESLRKKLKSGRQLRIKFGIDPTAPDIHLGNAVILWKLRDFQDLGHKIILIIGDFTAQIGDPTGKLSTRKMLTQQEIKKI